MQTTSAAKRAVAIALLAVALTPGRARAAAVAVLKTEATVKGPSMLLGEVASIKGSGPDAEKLKAVELGPSPLPGYARSVGSDAVRIRLKQLGMDPSKLAAGLALICRATRAFQTLSADRLIETARRFLQDQTGAGDGKTGGSRTVIEPLSHPLPLTLPVGKLELSAEPVGTSTVGSNRQVAVQVTVDGAPANRVLLSLRIREYVKVAIAKAAFAKGDAVTADRLGYEERDRTNLSPDVILEGEPLDELQAVQPISAGSPLTHRSAAAPAAIHRGDAVTLQARTGGITVSTPGTAMEDGRIGGTIRVKNASSQQEARALVLDPKTVEVNL